MTCGELGVGFFISGSVIPSRWFQKAMIDDQ